MGLFNDYVQIGFVPSFCNKKKFIFHRVLDKNIVIWWWPSWILNQHKNTFDRAPSKFNVKSFGCFQIIPFFKYFSHTGSYVKLVVQYCPSYR